MKSLKSSVAQWLVKRAIMNFGTQFTPEGSNVQKLTGLKTDINPKAPGQAAARTMALPAKDALNFSYQAGSGLGRTAAGFIGEAGVSQWHAINKMWDTVLGKDRLDPLNTGSEVSGSTLQSFRNMRNAGMSTLARPFQDLYNQRQFRDFSGNYQGIIDPRTTPSQIEQQQAMSNLNPNTSTLDSWATGAHTVGNFGADLAGGMALTAPTAGFSLLGNATSLGASTAVNTLQAFPAIAVDKIQESINNDLAQYGMAEENLNLMSYDDAVTYMRDTMGMSDEQITPYLINRQLSEVSKQLEETAAKLDPEGFKAEAAGTGFDIRKYNTETVKTILENSNLPPEQQAEILEAHDTFSQYLNMPTSFKDEAIYEGSRPVDIMQRPEGSNYSVTLPKSSIEHDPTLLKIMTVGREASFREMENLFTEVTVNADTGKPMTPEEISNLQKPPVGPVPPGWESVEGHNTKLVTQVALTNPRTGQPISREDYARLPVEDLIALARISGEKYPNLPITAELAEAAQLRMKDVGSEVDISKLLTEPELANPTQMGYYKEVAESYNKTYTEALKHNGNLIDVRTGRPVEAHHVAEMSPVEQDAFIHATSTVVQQSLDNVPPEDLQAMAESVETNPEATAPEGKRKLGEQTGVENENMLTEMWDGLDPGSKLGILVGLPLMFIGALNMFNKGSGGAMGLFAALLGGGLAAGSAGFLGEKAQGFIDNAFGGMGKMFGFGDRAKEKQEIEEEGPAPPEGVEAELPEVQTTPEAPITIEQLPEVFKGVHSSQVPQLIEKMKNSPQYAGVIKQVVEGFQAQVREAQGGITGRLVTPERALPTVAKTITKDYGLHPAVANELARYLVTNHWPG